MPRAVRARFEFAPGWGVPEVGALGGGAAIGFGLQWLWALLPLPGGLLAGGRAALLALPAAAAFGLVHADASGGSLLRQLRAARRNGRRPHRYLYRHREWSA